MPVLSFMCGVLILITNMMPKLHILVDVAGMVTDKPCQLRQVSLMLAFPAC
jgi:hypothetical protein